MKPIVLSIAALLLAGAATAQAQGPYPQWYVGGDAMFWELDPDGGDSADSVGLRVRGGAQFNDYFAVEGHLGTGGSDSSRGRDVDLDYLAGAYAKGILPLARGVRLYGLAGFTEVDLSSGPFSDSESDFSYGVGGEFDLTPNLAVGADYMRYLDEDRFTFDAASVGATYRF